ncbi:MAG: family transcriptional regulator, aerobic/anaerobic benzoate catabolism transcriptional [Gammaproteobacteria bacterium]|nr:family transcriptional regulator, aerobic/anaerobic benzoate catabolism transcriptional [Gammaproteobacteria bacterium]
MLYNACMPKKTASALKAAKAKSVRSGDALEDADTAFLIGIGAAIREARAQRGMSRMALAESAGVGERYLAQVELYGGNPSIVFLRRVAGALGMQLLTLLESVGARPAQKLIRRFLDGLPPDRLEETLRRLTEELGQTELVRRRRIALIGLRGAGKTTLGRALAKALRRPLIELDQEIERDAGMSLSEVFHLYGQAGYRKIERRCLARIINSQDDIVLTVGGGIVSEPETYELLLLNCFTVWVKAAPEEHMSRVIEQGDLRPMSGHSEAMQDLRDILTSREPLYGKADVQLDTSGKSIEQSLSTLERLIAPQ